LLPHVLQATGRSIEDCIFFDCFMERGAYYPQLHWDSNWRHWCPDADGFNLWYLLERDEDQAGEGNIFVAHTPWVSKAMPPVRLEFLQNGAVQVVRNEGGNFPRVLGYYDDDESFEADNFLENTLTCQYVDAAPGDCLIMSKRTLHMSDPRPHLVNRQVNRLALNIRVLLRPQGQETVPLDTSYELNEMRQNFKQLLKVAPGRPGTSKEPAPRCPGCGGDTCRQLCVDRHELVLPERT